MAPFFRRPISEIKRKNRRRTPGAVDWKQTVKWTIFFFVMPGCVAHLLEAGEDTRLKQVLAGNQRPEESKARDLYRHPYETLTFFGIGEDMTVIEVWPGAGWYTEILAPYLKDKGKLIAALYDRDPATQKPWMARSNTGFEQKCGDNNEVFGKVGMAALLTDEESELAPPGSVDMILDFRNAHNWMGWGPDNVVQAWHRALKKGGVVGLIDHRMDDDKPYDPQNGYTHENQIVAIMEKHGFKLVARSDINRNPADTKDHPRGVWTLPPTFALGDKDREKYRSIGESDRMTLKFVKL